MQCMEIKEIDRCKLTGVSCFTDRGRARGKCAVTKLMKALRNAVSRSCRLYMCVCDVNDAKKCGFEAYICDLSRGLRSI